MKNKKLSSYKVKKIIKYFCADIDATKAALLLDFNRKTINRYYSIFRKCIYTQQRLKLEETAKQHYLSIDYANSLYSHFVSKTRQGEESKLVVVIENGSNLHIYEPYNFVEQFSEKVKNKMHQIEASAPEDLKKYYRGVKEHNYTKYISFSNEEGSRTNRFLTYVKNRLSKFNGVSKYYTYHLKECEWRWQKHQEEMEEELWKLFKNQDGNTLRFKIDKPQLAE
ncbi:MAG: hypothetical protein ABF242_07620 [Flavobacteriales bacterium]